MGKQHQNFPDKLFEMDFEELSHLNGSDMFKSPKELASTKQGREFLREIDIYHKPKKGTNKIIAWDGEGVSSKDGRHWYILFGNSELDVIKEYNEMKQLSTRACLNLLVDTRIAHPGAVHVSFSFSYDVEMMLRDLSIETWIELYANNKVRWAEFAIEYIPHKYFTVTRYTTHGKKKIGKRLTVWDIFGFFQTSFVESIKANLKDVKGLETIVEGKGNRRTFAIEEIDTMIEPYWTTEIIVLRMLFEQLRDYLTEAELDPGRYHGPGAIAHKLNIMHGTKFHMQNMPEEYAWLSRTAFAGGRFEQFKVGRQNGKVYVYDINSAHPSGIAKLPSLTNGYWTSVNNIGELSDFGVYFLRYSHYSATSIVTPQPLFYRDRDGLVSFPLRVEGCYWQPEINAMRKTGHDIDELYFGYEFVHTGIKPFDWVPEMYETRRRWKAEKRGAQMALKLGLNSLFGKTAQRVGYDEETNYVPKWHQLEWAGYITSNTRATLWPALWQAWQLGGLIACETDSVISSKPLTLDIGKGLGEWGVEEYDDCVFLQNGVYFLLKNDEWIIKFRGLDRDSFNVNDVLSYLNTVDMSVDPGKDKEKLRSREIVGRTTRFVGGRAALHVNRPELWRTWQNEPRAISMGSIGKRSHWADDCYECAIAGNKMLGESMHYLRISHPECGVSYPHKIPWITELDGNAANWNDPYSDETFTP